MDVELCAVNGAVWCIMGLYATAVLTQMDDLPRAHVVFSFLSLGVMAIAMLAIGGVFVFLIPDAILGVLIYYAWRTGLRRGTLRLIQPGRLVGGVLLVVFIAITVFASLLIAGVLFFFLWPILALPAFLILPRKIKRAMLKSLLGGQYMGWDEVFPDRIRYNPRRRGTVLIELLIAFVVLAVCCTALVSLASGRRTLILAAERASMVRIAAQSEIERAKSLPFDALQPGSVRTFDIFLSDGKRKGELRVEGTEDPYVKRVRVVVEAAQMPAMERIDLVTLIAARERKGP